MVKIILKVTKINDTKYLLLDKASQERIRQEITSELVAGDLLRLDVLGLSYLDTDTRSYVCKVCEHHFDQEEEHPYCPACGSENLYETVENDTESLSTALQPNDLNKPKDIYELKGGKTE